ncbi:hypothetical protein GCM10010505_24700 [Kitasatospora aburaviensis]
MSVRVADREAARRAGADGVLLSGDARLRLDEDHLIAKRLYAGWQAPRQGWRRVRRQVAAVGVVEGGLRRFEFETER